MVDFDELLRIQKQMAGRIMQESDTDKKLQLLDVVNNLTTNKKKKLQVEHVMIEATAEGFSEEEVTRFLDELVDLGYLSYPEEGFVERA